MIWPNYTIKHTATLRMKDGRFWVDKGPDHSEIISDQQMLLYLYRCTLFGEALSFSCEYPDRKNMVLPLS